MKRPRLVVVGLGLAAHRALEHLQRHAPDHYDITVFGAEPQAAYNRILLSPVLAGEKIADDIRLSTLGSVTVHQGDPVHSIDRARREVLSRSGRIVGYERLLLATGSVPAKLSVPGAALPGVMGFRDLADVDTMLAAARKGGNAVVIGGGLLGIEAADGLRQRGMNVTLLHRSEVLLNQQLDPPAAELLRQRLVTRGLKLRLKAETAALLGKKRISAVQLKDGSMIPADLVVMAVGIQPEITLARAAGLACKRGVLVDDTLQTFDPRVYAIGECAEHRGDTVGLVAPAWQQAEICAVHLAGLGHRYYRAKPTATRLKVSGIDVFSAGDFSIGAVAENLIYRDPARGIYKRLIVQHNRLIGLVLVGDISDGPWYFELMEQAADLAKLRSNLLFGKPYCVAA